MDFNNTNTRKHKCDTYSDAKPPDFIERLPNSLSKYEFPIW